MSIETEFYVSVAVLLLASTLQSLLWYTSRSYREGNKV